MTFSGEGSYFFSGNPTPKMLGKAGGEEQFPPVGK